MLRFAIVLFSLLALPARANLGETVEQCVIRYGRPVGFSEASPKFPFGTVEFSATGYTLVIFVAKDKELGARVSKTDKSAFSDTEMQNILTADSGATPWTSLPSKDPTCLQWTRGDKASVLYDKTNHVLIFTSDEMTRTLHSTAANPTAASPAQANPPTTNSATP